MTLVSGSLGRGLSILFYSKITLCEYLVLTFYLGICFDDGSSPGGLLVGTDSHTPNAAGIAMLGIGGKILFANDNHLSDE